MGRKPEIDRDKVRLALERCPSASAAARELGISVNTVLQIKRHLAGCCQRCRVPIEGGGMMCSPCRKVASEYQRQSRQRRTGRGRCAACARPIEPPSTQFCAVHRAMRNAGARAQRKRNREVRGEEWGRKVSEWNRRQLYGEAGVRVWNRTAGACQICGAPYVKRRSHLHHMDGNHARNTEENLIVACRNCHNLLHQLQWHPRLEAFLPWFRKNYADTAL